MKSPAILFALLTASVYLISCGASDSKEGSVKSEATTTEQKSEEQVIKVTAKEYDKKYQENEVAADNAFKDKKIEITGIVESINKDAMDDVYIVLTGEGDVSMGVQCHLSDAGKAASIKKGEKITIAGTGGGMIVTIPHLTDCVIK